MSASILSTRAARVLMCSLLVLSCTWAAPLQSDGPINSLCPVLEDEPVEPDLLVEYDGHTIGFCCQRCRYEFLADPGAFDGWIAAQLSPSTADRRPASSAATARAAPPLGLARRVGRLHPLLVHFPVALFLAAALAEALFARRGRPAHAACARFCLAVGAVGALLSALLGWAAAFERGFPADLAGVLTWHRWLGTLTAVMGTLAWLLCRRAHRAGASRLALRLALALLVIQVVLTAHFGGELIRGPGYLFR